jgi:hypothetical protein
MPELVARVTVFIGSPGDVGPERLVVQEVIQDLNDAFAGFRNFMIEARTWERHAWPGFGSDAQDVINREVGSRYDIFVGLFWNRLGTPTPRAPSGTAEEFTQAYKMWQVHRSPTLMLYFRTTPASLDTDDEVDQRRQLVRFKTQVRGMGALASEYDTPEELRRLVTKHLIKELLTIERSPDIEQLNRRLNAQERALTVQDENLRRQQYAINALFLSTMSLAMYQNLRKIVHAPFGPYEMNAGLNRELDYLRTIGYVEIKSLRDIPRSGQDLSDFVRPTETGRQFVRLREETESVQNQSSI